MKEFYKVSLSNCSIEPFFVSDSILEVKTSSEDCQILPTKTDAAQLLILHLQGIIDNTQKRIEKIAASV